MCIVDGGAQSIGVSDSIELQVMEHLSPAYEDLFDNAEEFSLKVSTHLTYFHITSF